MAEHPLLIEFFESLYSTDNNEYLFKYADDLNAIRNDVVCAMFDGLDYTLFRADIDGKSAVRYMQWLLDAYAAEVTERFKRGELIVSDADAMAKEWARFNDFTVDFRKIFYRDDQ
jgi:hypothetical protein